MLTYASRERRPRDGGGAEESVGTSPERRRVVTRGAIRQLPDGGFCF